MKVNPALIRALVIVVIIGVLSLLVLNVLNKDINPDFSLDVDVAEMGQKVLQAVFDFVLSLINPERRGFL